MNDRAGVMQRLYDSLVVAKAQCAQMTFDAGTNADIFFPKTPTPMQRAYAVEFQCTLGSVLCNEMTPEEIDGIIPRKDAVSETGQQAR